MARCARHSFVPKPLNVRPKSWRHAVPIPTPVMLGRGKHGEYLTSRSQCSSRSPVGRTPRLKREVESLGATREPAPATLLFWISGRADRAVSVHLAYVPKSGGRIGDLSLVATDRDYTQHAQADVAPKCGGRTTRALLVFGAGGEDEERPTHSRAEVRLIVRCLCKPHCSRLPNDLSLSCTARAHVPKPTRHGGCRGTRAKTQNRDLQPT